MAYYPPLHGAADAGDFKTTNELLQLGANVNAADKYGFTPLVGAVLAGKIRAKFITEVDYL